jgi:(E)-4-hydroxy-3-methylbut-2-enyl-diphosphate synthase
VKGKVVRVVPEDQMVEALVDEAERIMEEGIEARLAAADENAEEISRMERAELIELRGTDANHVQEHIDRIREIAE